MNVVHVGDVVSRALNIGSGGDTRIPRVDAGVWEELGLSMSLMDRFMGETIEGVGKAEAFMDLIHGR